MKINIESKTQHQIFKQFKNQKLPITWTQYRYKICSEHVALYKKLGWFLIPIGVRSKRPINRYAWTDETLTYERAEHMAKKHFNLAVDLGRSRLICLDYEHRDVPAELVEWTKKTMCACSPRGIHFYWSVEKYPSREQLFELSAQWKEGFEWRGRGQYTLLPCSIVARKDTPPKTYEWIHLNTLCRFPFTS